MVDVVYKVCKAISCLCSFFFFIFSASHLVFCITPFSFWEANAKGNSTVYKCALHPATSNRILLKSSGCNVIEKKWDKKQETFCVFGRTHRKMNFIFGNLKSYDTIPAISVYLNLPITGLVTFPVTEGEEWGALSCHGCCLGHIISKALCCWTALPTPLKIFRPTSGQKSLIVGGRN